MNSKIINNILFIFLNIYYVFFIYTNLNYIYEHILLIYGYGA